MSKGERTKVVLLSFFLSFLLARHPRDKSDDASPAHKERRRFGEEKEHEEEEEEEEERPQRRVARVEVEKERATNEATFHLAYGVSSRAQSLSAIQINAASAQLPSLTAAAAAARKTQGKS